MTFVREHRVGDPLHLTDAEALDQIAVGLTGREWSAGDLEDVADVLRRTGREIREPDDQEGAG